MILALCLGFNTASAATVEASDGGKEWKRERVRTLKPAKEAQEVNRFGGSSRHTVEATGFFHLTKRPNGWWLVDPDGGLFIMKGVNSVEAKRVGRKDRENWAKDTYDLLTKNGFNTIGRWSSPEDFHSADKPIPWCGTLSFMGKYAKNRREKNGEADYPNETIPVFDPEWPEFCEKYARRETAKTIDDPWLIGHFSDNELPFRPDALEKYLSLPESDPGHQAALSWMKEHRYRKSDAKKERVQKEFLEVVARRYFETVASALKKADPNHLFLGSRIHGRCINESVIRASAVCDIISVNYYHRWEPEKKRIRDWEKWSGRPFFVSEFYAMKVTAKDTYADGAGYRVLEFEDAAAFYHTHVAALLRDIPSCVGWHWFKYADDTPNWQKGIVSTQGLPHQALLDGMKTLNDQAYTLRGLR